MRALVFTIAGVVFGQAFTSLLIDLLAGEAGLVNWLWLGAAAGQLGFFFWLYHRWLPRRR